MYTFVESFAALACGTLALIRVILKYVQLERLLSARIISAPVDECLRNERCSDASSEKAGGCSNIRKLTGEPHLVNTNSTSVVCLTASIQANCACATREFFDQSHDVECHADSCLNGGTCFQEDYSFTYDLLIICLRHLI